MGVLIGRPLFHVQGSQNYWKGSFLLPRGQTHSPPFRKKRAVPNTQWLKLQVQDQRLPTGQMPWGATLALRVHEDKAGSQAALFLSLQKSHWSRGRRDERWLSC